MRRSHVIGASFAVAERSRAFVRNFGASAPSWLVGLGWPCGWGALLNVSVWPCGCWVWVFGFYTGGGWPCRVLGGGCIGSGGLRGLYRFRAGLFWGSAAKWVVLAVPLLGLGFSILRGVVWFGVWFGLVFRHVAR